MAFSPSPPDGSWRAGAGEDVAVTCPAGQLTVEVALGVDGADTLRVAALLDDGSSQTARSPHAGGPNDAVIVAFPPSAVGHSATLLVAAYAGDQVLASGTTVTSIVDCAGVSIALALPATAATPDLPLAIGRSVTCSSSFSADFNGDGKPDFACASYGPSGMGQKGSFGVSLNNGDGTFAPLAFYTVGTRPTTVAIGDVDGDGHLDLVVGSVEEASVGPGAISILRNNGDGTFAPAVNHPFYVVEVGLADVTGDGKPDLLFITEQSRNVIQALPNNGDGTFGAAVDLFHAAGQTAAIVSADLDADGDVDLVVPNERFDFSSGRITIALNDGSGHFAATADLPVIADQLPVQRDACAVRDLDGDGKPDIAFVSGNSIDIFKNAGGARFVLAPLVPTEAPFTTLVAGDFDGDGTIDLAASGALNSYVVSIFLNRGDATFDLPFDLGGLFGTGDLVMADFDGDGHVDLAAGGALLLARHPSPFAAARAYAVATGPEGVAVTDLDGDGKPDLAVADLGTYLHMPPLGSLRILRNRGDGTFAPLATYLSGTAPNAIAASDLDGDKRADLVVADSATRTLMVLMNHGDGTFGVPTPYALTAEDVRVGDVNGDGKPDVVAVSYDSFQTEVGTLSVFVNQGDGTLAPPATYPAGYIATKVMLADLNGDGALDVVVSADALTSPGIQGGVLVFVNHGDGTLAPAVPYPTSQTPVFVVARDMNGDGKPDLLIGQRDNVLMLNNGDGTFGAATTFLAGEGRILFGDVDGDGITDVVGGSMRIYPGLSGGGFGTPTAYAAGWPSALADLDGDGRLDVIGDGEGAVTVSLNTR